MKDFKEKLKLVPELPGSYQMKDKNGYIIYVGKAKNLKKRVSSYFRGNVTGKTAMLVSDIDDFEYIVTSSELESLILEINLIKKYNPKYNILLKDDKSYPYIKIDIKDDYPTVVITRRLVHDGSKYFGPYANPGSAKEMVDFIKKKFKIRQCRNYKTKNRVCLNYHIGRCLGPCVKNVSKEEYMKQIDQIRLLLERKDR